MPNSACFPALLRRLLCSGDLPTHPSEPLSEAKLVARPAEPGPGVVARLMGLSSLPDPNYRAPGAVTRSKSVNFADYLLHFDSNQAHHRRARTSASFREVRPLNQDNDFFLLYTKDYFDGYSVETEPRLKKLERPRCGGEKPRSVNEVKKKKGNERMNECKISKLKDEPRREIGKNFTMSKKCSTSKESVSVLPSGKYKQSATKNGNAVNSKSIQKNPTKQKEAAIGTELNQQIKRKNKNISRHVGPKPEPETDPENSSPVSVLDVGLIDFSDERRMERIATESGDFDLNGSSDRSEGSSELVGRICRLAEEDIREAKWRVKSVKELGDLEELCMEVERHVVNVLLVETLDELVYL